MSTTEKRGKKRGLEGSFSSSSSGTTLSSENRPIVKANLQNPQTTTISSSSSIPSRTTSSSSSSIPSRTTSSSSSPVTSTTTSLSSFPVTSRTTSSSSSSSSPVTSMTTSLSSTPENSTPRFLPRILYRFVKPTSDFFKPGNELNLQYPPINPGNRESAEHGIFSLSGKGDTINAITYLTRGDIELDQIPQEFIDYIKITHTYGSGGNITGFLEYTGPDDDYDKLVYNFGLGGSADVIIILCPMISETTNFPFYFSEGILTDDVIPCHDMVKVARLGKLMTPDPNKHEWNFITNQCVNLPAIRLKGTTLDIKKYVKQINDWLDTNYTQNFPLHGPIKFNECPKDHPKQMNPDPCEDDIQEPIKKQNKKSDEDSLSISSNYGGRKSKSNKPKKTRKTSRKPKSKTRRSKSRY